MIYRIILIALVALFVAHSISPAQSVSPVDGLMVAFCESTEGAEFDREKGACTMVTKPEPLCEEYLPQNECKNQTKSNGG